MDVLISGTMAIESANLAFFLKKITEQVSSISGRIAATTCPVLHAHEQCRCSTRPSAFLPEPVHPPQLMALDHSPPSSLDGDPCTVGCQHSCAQRGGSAGEGRWQRGSTPAGEKPPRARTTRDSRARASPALLPAAVLPPPATVEPRCRHMRCEMEEAARGRRRRLQRPARSPRLIRDVTERSMNAVAPRAYPHRSPVRVYIKLLSNICNERIQQEKLEKCRDDSQTTDGVSNINMWLPTRMHHQKLKTIPCTQPK